MKRTASILCGLLLASSLLGSPVETFSAEYELNFIAPYFDRHPTVVNVFRPWIKELADKTGGALEISYYAPNTICPEPEIMDSVAQGVVDMGGNTFGRNAGRLVITEVAQVPMLNKYPKTSAMAWWDVTQKYPQYFPEFEKDIKLLFVWTSALTQIHTMKKPVRTLEDLKGMKIIAWNSNSMETLKALGAVPMLQSSADTYLALERGMADGLLAPFAPLRSQKLTELLKYHTVCDLALSPFWGGINRDTYDGLPENLRKALDDSTGLEFSGTVGQSLEDGADVDVEWIREQGRSELIVLDAAERARWKDATSSMLDEAVRKAAAAGIPADKAREVFDYYGERIAHYNGRFGLQ